MGSPIYFWVVEGKPGVSNDHHLLSKVCDSKVGSFRVTSKAEGDVDWVGGGQRIGGGKGGKRKERRSYHDSYY